MRWKRGYSEIFLFLAILHFALSNKHSKESIRNKDERESTKRTPTILPGPETAILQSGHIVHLDNMSFLDPYNMMSSMKRKEKGETIPYNPLINIVSSHHPHKMAVDSKTKQNLLSDRKSLHGKNDKHANRDFSDSSPTEAAVSSFTDDNNKNLTKSGMKGDNVDIQTDTPLFSENDFNVYDDYGENGAIDRENNIDIPDGTFTGVGEIGGGRREGGGGGWGGQGGKRKNQKWRKRHEERNALLHEAVRKLLGFSQSPNGRWKHRRLLPDPNREEKLPRYVKDLYERFQSGEMSAGLARGNTIRSIHGSVGK